MAKFKIGDIEYKTKSEAIKMVRAFLHNQKNRNKPWPAMTLHHSRILELLKLHPDAKSKIGPGIDYFIILSNKITPDFGEFNFKRVDGTYGHFSFRSCFAPSSEKNYIFEAMRTAIKHQLARFRLMNEGANCYFCGTLATDVDHLEPEFKTIRDDFIKSSPEIIDVALTWESIDNRCYFSNQLDSLVIKWKDYHKSEAKLLVMACRGCNGRKKEDKLAIKFILCQEDKTTPVINRL